MRYKVASGMCLVLVFYSTSDHTIGKIIDGTYLNYECIVPNETGKSFEIGEDSYILCHERDVIWIVEE